MRFWFLPSSPHFPACAERRPFIAPPSLVCEKCTTGTHKRRIRRKTQQRGAYNGPTFCGCRGSRFAALARRPTRLCTRCAAREPIRSAAGPTGAVCVARAPYLPRFRISRGPARPLTGFPRPCAAWRTKFIQPDTNLCVSSPLANCLPRFPLPPRSFVPSPSAHCCRPRCSR